jgi:hypothetical protein
MSSKIHHAEDILLTLTTQQYLSNIVYNSLLHTSESYGNLVPLSLERQTMRVRRTLAPDQKGTKKLLHPYDSQLVCARYRDDAERRLRFTTDERTSATRS